MTRCAGRSLLWAVAGWSVALLACPAPTSRAAAAQQQQQQPAATAPDDLAATLRPVRERAGLPAMGAVVVRGDGRVAAVGVEGVRRAGGKERVTRGDQWHIGSNTKSMTATLCAMLVEEGKLKWTTTLADAFPDLAPKMRPRWRTVTLEQLLTNRGGMPGDLTKSDLWGQLWQFKGRPEQARDLLLRGVVTAQGPEAEPGTKYIYSNAGFSVAGHTAEAVMKKPWETLLRERLFAPLGMKSAGFGAPGAARGAVDQPRGHTADGKPRDPGPGADNPVAIGPAGIVHCSLADYAKYLALHLRGERNGGATTLLKPETFKKLHEPPAGPGQKYAMGWIVVPDLPGAGRALSHDGSNTMWYVTAWVLPEHDLAVAVACNKGGDGAARACHEVAQQLMREYVGRDK